MEEKSFCDVLDRIIRHKNAIEFIAYNTDDDQLYGLVTEIIESMKGTEIIMQGLMVQERKPA